MESLRNLRFRPIQWLLCFLLSVTVLIPFLYFLIRASLEFRIESLSWVFIQILFRSLGISFIQAFTSALLVLVIGLIVGTMLALCRSTVFLRLGNFVNMLGALAFILPTLSISFLVMDLAKHLVWVPSQGLWAIVLAHFLINVLFVVSMVQFRINSWLNAEGRELCEAAASLGAKGTAFYKETFLLLWKDLTKTYFPLVFLWSFTAFTTVVILGGSPQFASPEVLLYYSLQNDLDLTRILLLVAVQFFVLFFVLRKGIVSNQVVSVLNASTEQKLSEQALGFFQSSKAKKAALLIVLFILICPFMWMVISPVTFLLKGISVDSRLSWAFVNSAVLAVFTSVFSCFWALCLLCVGSKFRRLFVYLLGFSTTLLLGFWMAIGWDTLFESKIMGQIILGAFALSIVQVPLASFWLERRIQSFACEAFEAAASLGCTRVGALRFLYIPQLRDVIVKITFVAGVGAVGELAIAQLFVHDADLVAGLSHRLMLRYDFSGAYWVLISLVLMSTAFYGLSRRWQRT